MALNVFDLHKENQFTDVTSKSLLDDGELWRFSKFLGRDFASECRVAQSIITRSEVELFGISSPRFATRIYLKDGGFINYRRLTRLTKNIPKLTDGTFGGRYPEGVIDENCRNCDLKPKEFKTDINVGGSIADCILPVPLRLTEGKYQFIKLDAEELFATYAEKITPPTETQYTPYVKPTELGGGQCAQAACFVATALLTEHASSLCGIAEITAYAHPEKCCELSLSGLTPFKMQQYFSCVDLRMSQQAIHKNSVVSLIDDERQKLAMALRCYLHSNMPVIFPVDCREMQKQKVYISNSCEPKHKIIKTQPHVITLIGYKAENDWFAFHDPGEFPYMAAKVSQLAEVGCEGDTIHLKDAGVFMPVTPAKVQMPLGWERVQGEDGGKVEPRIGLFTISSNLLKLNRPNFPQKRSGISRMTPFILGQKLELKSIWDEQLEKDEDGKKKGEQYKAIVACVNQMISKIAAKQNWVSSKWLWFEIFDDGALVWNAELPPHTLMPETAPDCFYYLLGVVTQVGDKKYESLNVGSENHEAKS